MARQELSSRLLGSVAKKPYDPAVDIGWAAPIPAGLYGLSPEWSTLYSTGVRSALGQLGGVEADRGGRGEVETLGAAAHRDPHAGVG